MIYRILLVLFLGTPLLAQESNHRCGTTPSEEMVNRLLENKLALEIAPNRRLELQYVPLTFHLVGRNDGSDRIAYNQVMEQICDLNEIYAAFDMQFYLKDDGFRLVNNTSAFENGQGASSLFNGLKDPNSVNIFVVESANSGGGGLLTLAFYDPIRDYIVTRKDMVESVVKNVMPHEIGHYFSLLHTFNGWETDPYDATKHGNPVIDTIAPDNVTPVELVDKSNCEVAGDFICDTEPDYNFGITQSGCIMPVAVSDPRGSEISVAKENFMTYFFNCGSYFFTPTQRTLIRTDYESPDRMHIRDDNFSPSSGEITGVPNPLTPENGDFESFYNSVLFEWSGAPGADRYFLEISRNSSFTDLIESSFVRNTSKLVTNLGPNTQYFWRVKPVNDLNYCNPYGSLRAFTTGGSVTSNIDPESVVDVRIMPNPIKSGSPATLRIRGLEGVVHISIMSYTGRQVGQLTTSLSKGINRIEIPTTHLDSGVYIALIENDGRIVQKKLVIQH